MSFDIASYDGRPALVLDRRTEDREDGSVEVADIRVFATNTRETDEYLNGVELDQADDAAPAAEESDPTDAAGLGQHQA